jgi:hypothetical protein
MIETYQDGFLNILSPFQSNPKIISGSPTNLFTEAQTATLRVRRVLFLVVFNPSLSVTLDHLFKGLWNLPPGKRPIGLF